MSGVAVALVHHPCLDKHGEVYATSITNLDVHDIARSSRTYSVDVFYIVHPVDAQREMAQAVVDFWAQPKNHARNPDRSEALSRARVVATVEDAKRLEAERLEKPIFQLSTSAKPCGKPVSFEDGVSQCADSATGTLIVFGTGHGLAPSVIDSSDGVLVPVLGPDPYNHLSVRSAVAIIIDRLLGR